jgi:hypothetical protein
MGIRRETKMILDNMITQNSVQYDILKNKEEGYHVG